jgi:hypothetical protein
MKKKMEICFKKIKIWEFVYIKFFLDIINYILKFFLK